MDIFKPVINIKEISPSSTIIKPKNKFDNVTNLTNDFKKNVNNNFEEVSNKLNEANEKLKDAKDAKTNADTEASNAKKAAKDAKTAADEVNREYTAAKADYDVKQAEYASQTLKLPPIVLTINLTKSRASDAFKKLEEVKNKVKKIFIDTIKAKTRIAVVIAELLTAYKSVDIETENQRCAQDIYNTAKENNDNTNNISNAVNEAAIDINTNIMNPNHNKEYNETLKKYLPLSDQDPIKVNEIVKAMNILSIQIAKKYCEDYLKKQTTLQNPTVVTGGKKYSIKKHNLYNHNRHTMRRYTKVKQRYTKFR